MALQPCAECGTQISNMAAACPQCGAPPARLRKTKWWLWIPLGLIITFVIFALIVGSSPEAKQRADERIAIELCWRNQKDPALESSTQRFIAGACQKMESDFRDKHGLNP